MSSGEGCRAWPSRFITGRTDAYSERSANPWMEFYASDADHAEDIGVSFDAGGDPLCSIRISIERSVVPAGERFEKSSRNVLLAPSQKSR